MTLAALQGGAQAAGRESPAWPSGSRPISSCSTRATRRWPVSPAPDMLSAHVFASHRSSAIAEAWVAGRQRVKDGRHAFHDVALSGFTAARRHLNREERAAGRR